MLSRVVMMTIFYLSMVHASTAETWNHESFEFENSSAKCAETDTCNLKKFYVKKHDFQVRVSGDPHPTSASSLYAGYVTDKPEELNKYGIVQFIRGCQYRSKLVNGQIEKKRSVVRYFYGDGFYDYHHPNWVIDGAVTDPLSWDHDGDPQAEPADWVRHLYYQWNTQRGSHSKGTRKYVKSELPRSNHIYVTDMPGETHYSPLLNEALNISLEFKTCLYKESDVPRYVAPENVNFAEPISCYEWASSFIYNHQMKKYEQPKGIVPYCLEPRTSR